MDDIYTYCVPLPPGVHEAVLPCQTGYTVYLNDNDTPERRMEAYQHAMKHIQNNDFSGTDVQQIEAVAHNSMGKVWETKENL